MSSTQSKEGTTGLIRLIKFTSIWQLFATIIFVLFLRFITRGIYRVYFHPLSKFPGPKSRAFTRIPHHVATWTGTGDKAMRELHEKYGHVVRVNPDELSFTDPNSWKDIYGHGTKGTAGLPPQKDQNMYGRSPNGAFNLVQAHDPEHSRMRKIFTPAFSDRALKQQEPLFVRYTDLLVSKLKDGIDRKWDMVRMYNFTTFDIMGDLTFGEPLHMLEDAEYDPWVRAIFANIKIASKASVMMKYPLLRGALRKAVPMNKKRGEQFQHAVTRVSKRLQKGRDTEGVDLWDLVLSQKEGRGLSRDEMDANASLFMVAGTETTATSLSGLTNFLLTNPEKMKKLVDEIRGAFTSADDMTMEQLAALPYLAATIKESLRLYPPIPLGLPRLVPQIGSTVVGQFIPPGTTVSIPQQAMFTLEKNFKRGLEFIPERWLGDSEFDSDEKHALQPFSVGSHDCLGKNMAYHEMRLIVAKVLYTFDLELAPESRNWGGQECHMLWQKPPLMCKLKAVN
ncbi:cytochrome P450 [Pyrenochaeta sp. MPI-SDFR-AT-0127]|nr:cytochrome P450 [Pyrenochaeta sp. MPI-SDFR-AT-0127]